MWLSNRLHDLKGSPVSDVNHERFTAFALFFSLIKCLCLWAHQVAVRTVPFPALRTNTTTAMNKLLRIIGGMLNDILIGVSSKVL